MSHFSSTEVLGLASRQTAAGIDQSTALGGVKVDSSYNSWRKSPLLTPETFHYKEGRRESRYFANTPTSSIKVSDILNTTSILLILKLEYFKEMMASQ